MSLDNDLFIATYSDRISNFEKSRKNSNALETLFIIITYAETYYNHTA